MGWSRLVGKKADQGILIRRESKVIDVSAERKETSIFTLSLCLSFCSQKTDKALMSPSSHLSVNALPQT